MIQRYGYPSMLATSALKAQSKNLEKFGASIVIIDLEDSVAFDQKDAAREIAIDIFSTPSPSPRCLRINSIRTIMGLRDMTEMLQRELVPDVLHIPKVESAEEIAMIDELLCASKIHAKTRLGLVIESVKGVENCNLIANSSPRIDSLVFGAADYATDCGLPMSWNSMYYARSRVAFAASSAGIAAVDSPNFDLHDNHALILELESVKELGFSAKIAVHPRQIDPINTSFSMQSTDLVTYAKDVLRQSEESSEPCFTLGGKMIGPPMISQAKKVLSLL